MYMDGVDFTPANRNVLFGYQFKSIAALGPILGPIIAVQWGWLPALLWIVFGTFFIGWVQDYTSIIMGVREEGKSFGALSYKLISPRAKIFAAHFHILLPVVDHGLFRDPSWLQPVYQSSGTNRGHHRHPGRNPGRTNDLQMEARHYSHFRGHQWCSPL